MKFFTSIGPNPRVVEIFLKEKGLDVPEVKVDIMGGENRQAEYTARNPSSTMPCLELDDGSTLAEITAICEYLEELNPSPTLIGSTAQERAETRMWTRRIDLGIVEPMTSGFRYSDGLPLFKDRMRTIPEAADGLKLIAKEKLEWLEGQIEGREYICGDRFTLADILLFAFLEFGAQVGQGLDAKHGNLQAWYTRVAARPSIAS